MYFKMLYFLKDLLNIEIKYHDRGYYCCSLFYLIHNQHQDAEESNMIRDVVLALKTTIGNRRIKFIIFISTDPAGTRLKTLNRGLFDIEFVKNNDRYIVNQNRVFKKFYQYLVETGIEAELFELEFIYRDKYVEIKRLCQQFFSQ